MARKGRRYQPPVTAEQRAQAAAAREEKLAALHRQLAEQVAALAAGPEWRRWLDVAARFHNYSLNNTLLILAQRPAATQVAGYSLWQQLGRQVTKGERGIAILAPITWRADPDGQRAPEARANQPSQAPVAPAENADAESAPVRVV